MAGIKEELSEGSQLLLVDLAGATDSYPVEADGVMTARNWEDAAMQLMLLVMRHVQVQRATAQEQQSQPQDREA
jgi:hypothetical protein